MPIYEFYCEPCHTIYTFRSPRVDTRTVPACPVCGARLAREVSAFAHIVKGKNSDGNEDAESPSVQAMDQVIAKMGDRLQSLDADDADPSDAVRVMREMASAGGLTFNKDVQEAMARIEAGEDPEKIDEQFKEVFDTENPFEAGTADAKSLALWRRLRGPRRDPKWYDIPPSA